jgi:hypothetical protein
MDCASSSAQPGGQTSGQDARELRRARQGLRQAHQFARADLAQCGARGDPLDVARTLEFAAQRLPQTVAQQPDGGQPLARLRALTAWVQQPAAQRAAAHAGVAGVQQREQRGMRFATQGVGEFEVAPGVDRQVDQLAAARHLQAFDVGQRAALRVLGIGQQRRSGCVRVFQVLRVPGGQAGSLQLFKQLALAQTAVEGPGRPYHSHRALAAGQGRGGQLLQRLFKGGRDLGAVEQLAGRHPGDPVRQFVARALGQKHDALGDRQPGQPDATARARVHCHQQCLGLV